MRILDESQAKKLLARYDIAVPNFDVVENEDEIEKMKLKYPVVMKVCSSKILHKTDVGGVVLNIMDENQLKKNFIEMRRRFPQEKILIEEMEKPGIEMIVGINNDEFFGKVIMAGMGGIYTELYKDVSFRKIPISKKDAESMLKDLKAYKIFEGFRNIKGDADEMIELLLKISNLAIQEKVHQMDLNPVIVYEKGLKVVDAKVILE